MPDCVKSFKFISEDYCKEISDKVHAFKDHWIHRGGYFDYPFYTLGVASYLDAPRDNTAYYADSRKSNLLLKENFSDLYLKTTQFLEENLSKKCIMDETHALPGFHVFLDSDFFEIPVASKHVDLQYKLLNWQEDQKFDPKNNISFTVYTAMPSGGGGLYFWDLTYGDLDGLGDRDRNEKLSDNEPELISFDTGDLVIHTGLNYHQIAPMIDVQPGDNRISLQGHGVLVDDVYHLYW